MKIIVTGPTGFIGSNVLQSALSHSAITSIVAFSRRQLPPLNDPQQKLTVIIQSDFLNYSEDTLEACAGAEACIWCLGGPTRLTTEAHRKINFNFTIAAATAFLHAKVSGDGKKFTFIYLSGIFVEKDQARKLWFLTEARKIRGEVEIELMNMQKKHEEAFIAYIARPGPVLPTNSFFPALFEPWAKLITIDDLAAKMLDTAINGHSTQTLEVQVLRDEGKRLRMGLLRGEQ